MNKHEKMKGQIIEHGNNLNIIFNTGLDAYKLCSKLHSLELKAHKIALDWCNGENGVTTDNIDFFVDPILKKVNAILKPKFEIYFNGDARGYALKISDKIMKEHNLKLYTDWGGYGILAPEFDGN